ncbi:MAG: Uma2 family endonuclease [Acidobacteria bacterium]|nr:Uma2 family endonuclease [Acidobacteriota bacterium]
MGLPQKKPKFVSPEEYLAFERDAVDKHEYFNGEIFAMAGAGKRHNLIAANLIRLIGNQLVDRVCNVYGSDMRVKVPSGNYTYPDVVAVCGEELFEDKAEDNLLNPLVIIEVLSRSTEAYDRGAKFEQYQTIPSFREYVLITQEPYRVEQFVRQDVNAWTYLEFRTADDAMRLESIDCELRLSDIYFKVEPTFPKQIEA